MPKTVRRASEDHSAALTDEQRHAIAQHLTTQLAAAPARTEQANQIPAEVSADRTAHVGLTDEQDGNREQRRARQPQVSRTLARDIARRNKHQLIPHAVTAGLVALAQTIHYAASQAHALGAAALASGTVCAAAGAIGVGLWRKRAQLNQQWTAWAAVAATATSVWMVIAVAAGITWGSLAAALAADYTLAARWFKHHRHPAAVEPQPEPEPEMEVDESLIATFMQRWADNVASQNGVLPESTLTYADTFYRGIEYVLHLKPGQQTIDQVRNNLARIATGIGRHQENLVVEPRDEDDDPAKVTLRVITSSPVRENVLFSELRYHDGHIPLGPYADGIGEAMWRLYTDDSMWGGLVIGATGTGKSRLLEMIALEALYTGFTYVMHLDGQDGSSCPVLWEHAQERYGVDDVDRLLDRLARMLRRRNRVCGGSFTPTPELPGVLVVVDETNAVLDRDNLKRWLHIARQGRKCGMAVVMGDQDGSLETFLSSTFRGQLRKGNGAGMKTEEASQGQILGKGKLDLSELPEIPGFGYTLGNFQRRAPYKGRFLMAGKDADRARQRGHEVPDDLMLIEQWYADAPKIALDAATDDGHGAPEATGDQPAQPSPVRGSDGPTLVPMALPTVGESTPTPNPASGSGAMEELTDAQYQVFDCVTLGLVTPAEIAEQLDLSRKYVGQVLGQLIESGLVTKSGAGKAVRYEAATVASSA